MRRRPRQPSAVLSKLRLRRRLGLSRRPEVLRLVRGSCWKEIREPRCGHWWVTGPRRSLLL
jgi:hypothetical protein